MLIHVFDWRGSRQGLRCRATRGFTLVELLVVIAIISILMALTMPLGRKVRESANRVACASNLRQIGICMRLYADDHDGYLPTIAKIGVANQPGYATHVPFAWDTNTLIAPLQNYGLLFDDLVCPATTNLNPPALDTNPASATYNSYMTNYLYLPGLADPKINNAVWANWYDSPGHRSAASIRPFLKYDSTLLVVDMNLFWATGINANTLWSNHVGQPRRTRLADVSKLMKGSNRLYTDLHVEWVTPKQMGKDGTEPTSNPNRSHYSHDHADRPYFW